MTWQRAVERGGVEESFLTHQALSARVYQHAIVEDDQAKLTPPTLQRGQSFLFMSVSDELLSYLPLALGMVFFAVVDGFVVESVFHVPGFKFGWFVGFAEVLGCLIISKIEIMLLEKPDCTRLLPHSATVEKPKQPSLYMFAAVSFALIGSVGMKNASLAHLNFPTKEIFQSGKLISVMALGRTFSGKVYSTLEYVGAFVLLFGLSVFMLANVSVEPSSDLAGMILILGSITCDGINQNLQERFLKGGKLSAMISRPRILLYCNFFALPSFFLILLVKGELVASLSFCMEHPVSFVLLAAHMILDYFRILFHMELIKSAGAAFAYLVVIVRKFLTIVFSFLFFTKPFSFSYLYGGFLVFVGLGIMVNSKFKKHQTVSKTVADHSWTVFRSKPPKKDHFQV